MGALKNKRPTELLGPYPATNGGRKNLKVLPVIQANNRQLRRISKDVMSALLRINAPPFLFVRGGRMVTIRYEDRWVIKEVDLDILVGIMSRVANFQRQTSSGSVQCLPPRSAARDILALPPSQWGFPALVAITEVPVMRPDGSILQRVGYDPATGMFYAPSDQLEVPPVPEDPTVDDVKEALGELEDILADFLFVDPASKANCIGAMLTAICRPAISGPTPIALIDATSAGTGKTLLTEVISIIVTGREGTLFSAPEDKAEWRKQLTSVLLEGAPVVVIDNISGRLDSEELSRVLTAVTYGDRLLGTNQTVALPVTCIWLATGNNIQLGGDVPRRACWIRMDAKTARPFERTGFRHPDLKAFVKEHRGKLLSALLTLARAWFSAGRPKPSVPPVGSFESWTSVVGGILEYADVHGFLANSSDLYNQADVESDQWAGFLLTLGEVFGEKSFRVSELVDMLSLKTDDPDIPLGDLEENARKIRQALPDSVVDAMDRPGALRQRLGREFAARAGRRFGDSGVHIEKDGKFRHATRWKVVRV